MNPSNTIISHVRQTDMSVQSNDEHQSNVAELAAAFASEFGLSDFGRIAGLLHDKGKEQEDWQKYIRGITGLNAEYAGFSKHPDHAYVGACIAKKLYPQFAPMLAQPIAGHHRGLYDYCEYEELLKKAIPDDVSIPAVGQLPTFLPGKMEQYDLHHFVRMLFSCLVDADSLDTETFMSPDQALLRGSRTTMEDLLAKLVTYLKTLREVAGHTEVNDVRNYVQEQCIKESRGDAGFYSLTVPTGGGKTLASVLWALHHAVRNHLHRIIIAIPYTSIIVQTAATLKAVFGEENVLEHHSNFNPENVKDRELRERLQLATENWDYPIVVTTNVQFFESLFSNKRSDCRKLHNIVSSVIILDEVQTLPMEFYKPIVNTLDTLRRVFGVSVLFTTASQPVLTGRIEGTNPNSGFDALSGIREIIPAETRLYEKLRRVELEFLPGSHSYDDIADAMAAHRRVLCIVNTRKDAKELYDRLPKDGICLHLSRMMCPAHVSATIQYLKALLKEDEDTPVRVIATQLIEAGVDIDFPVVFRQEAGLDSILQAAGRCNREGKRNMCTTYVFSLGIEHPLPPGMISQANNARLGMGPSHDWFAPEAMACYFRQLHSRVDSFDVKQMEELLYKPECEFEEAAKRFRLIDDKTVPVIVNWGESMTLYQRLVLQGPSYSLLKKLSQYSVSLRERDFRKLQGMGAVEEPFENIYAIANPSFYKADTGLSIDNQWLEETYII